MRNLIILCLIFLSMACAASNPPQTTGSGNQDDDNFMANVCKNIDFNQVQALGENPDKMYSCADVARCASIMGIAPPDIPCR